MDRGLGQWKQVQGDKTEPAGTGNDTTVEILQACFLSSVLAQNGENTVSPKYSCTCTVLAQKRIDIQWLETRRKNPEFKVVLCWEHCRSLAEANTNSHQKKITFPQNHSFIQIFLLNTNPAAGTVLETGDLTGVKQRLLLSWCFHCGGQLKI